MRQFEFALLGVMAVAAPIQASSASAVVHPQDAMDNH
ncbi:MAG: hypothetical protein ACI835_003048 [Planctomycetota bacterium]|jgi:hypothetical protein